MINQSSGRDTVRDDPMCIYLDITSDINNKLKQISSKDTNDMHDVMSRDITTLTQEMRDLEAKYPEYFE